MRFVIRRIDTGEYRTRTGNWAPLCLARRYDSWTVAAAHLLLFPDVPPELLCVDKVPS